MSWLKITATKRPGVRWLLYCHQYRFRWWPFPELTVEEWFDTEQQLLERAVELANQAKT